MAGSTAHVADANHRQGASDRLRRLLRSDETLLWSTKPHTRGWHVGTVAGMTLALTLVGTLFGLPFAYIAFQGGGSALLGVGTAVLTALGAVLAVAGTAAVLAHLMYRHAEMALTDDRLVRLGGLVGQDASSVALEDVRDIDVRVYLFDKLYGTGRIHVQVAGGPAAGLRMGYVPDPYEVLDRIEELRAQATGEVDEGR